MTTFPICKRPKWVIRGPYVASESLAFAMDLKASSTLHRYNYCRSRCSRYFVQVGGWVQVSVSGLIIKLYGVSPRIIQITWLCTLYLVTWCTTTFDCQQANHPLRGTLGRCLEWYLVDIRMGGSTGWKNQGEKGATIGLKPVTICHVLLFLIH